MANRVVEARDRQARALELRLTGMSYEDIATALGYADRATAYRACTAVLDRREAESADQMRTIEGAKLDKLEAKLWTLANAGDLAAIDRILKVMHRRANLYGLDLAGRLDVVAGGEVDLDGVVAKVMLAARGQLPTADGEGDEGDGGV